MTVAVVDVDGVVADVRHRLHHLAGARRDWGAFFAAAADDPPLAEGLAVVADLRREHDVVWLTGRPESLREVTVAWLTAHGLPADDLVMRAKDDRRPARVMKLGALRRLAPRGVAAVLDDDPEVIAAARAAGLPAVLADWVPRGETLSTAQDRLGRT